jgi:hypothetical protein
MPPLGCYAALTKTIAGKCLGLKFKGLDAAAPPPAIRGMLSGKQDDGMASTVKVFGSECDIHGARVFVTREPLTPSCLTDAEVDFHIQLLKDDLDAVAVKMKKAIRDQAKKADF